MKFEIMRRVYMKSRHTHYRWIQTALTFNPMARKFLLLPIKYPFLLSPILTDLSNQWRSCCRMKITTYTKVIICLKHWSVRRFNFYFIVDPNYKLTQLFHNIRKVCQLNSQNCREVEETLFLIFAFCVSCGMSLS